MTPQDYETLLAGAPIDSESVTYLLVAGASVAEVASALDADVSVPGFDLWGEGRSLDDEESAYAFAQLAGGVIAMEPLGYADPSTATLRALSGSGRTAAVARANIQGHYRFGYARDGELVFDADEYVYLDGLDEIPEEVRALAAHAWDHLDDESDKDDVDPLAVALEMCVQVTGLTVTADDLTRAAERGFHRVRTLAYLDD